MKKLLIAMAVLLGLVSIYLLLSPYQHHAQRESYAIVNSIEINATADELYAYLGNSANAADWSTYVSRIEPLNAEKFRDGERNSKRRCFYKQDKNRTWDERIDSTRENAYRRLRIYNLQNFPMHSEQLLTEQIYKPTKNGTKLSLTLYLDEEASLFDHLKMQAAAFIISSIFEKNLQKIKSINER